MVTKLDRNVILKEYPLFPTSDDLNEEYFFPKVYTTYILGTKLRQVTIESISVSFIQLLNLLNINELAFLGDTDLGWIDQKNQNIEIKSAYKYLKKFDLEANFSGGVVVNGDDIYDFVKNIIAITKFNTALPIVNFIDPKQNFMGNICRYLNLHINTFSSRTDHFFLEKVKESNFVFLQKC